MESSADPSSTLAMLERCNHVARHPKGDIDTRITAFCEALFAQFPVTAADAAWMTDPEVGIDHLIMHLSWSPRSGPVIETIQELAWQHRLVLVDPQSDDVYLPVMPAACQNRPETTDIEQ
jgi:hypothetical protein